MADDRRRPDAGAIGAELAARYGGARPSSQDAGGEGRGLFRGVGDTVLGVGEGVTGMAQGIVGLNALNPLMDLSEGGTPIFSDLYQGLGRLRESIGGLQSEQQQAAERRVADAIANSDGFFDGVQNTAGALSLGLLPGMIGEALGSVGAIGAIGRGAGAVGRAAQATRAAGSLGQRVGTALATSPALRAGLAEGATAAGLVAGEINDTEGTTYADRLFGVPAGVVTAAVGRLGASSKLDPERFLDDLFSTSSAAVSRGQPVRDLARHTVSRIARTGEGARRGVTGALAGATREAVEEGVQETNEQLFTNAGTGRDLDEGLGGAFTMGAAMGAVAGGGLGTVRGLSNTLTGSSNLNEVQRQSNRSLRDRESGEQQESTASTREMDDLGRVARFIATEQARARGGPEAAQDSGLVARVTERILESTGRPGAGMPAVRALMDAAGLKKGQRRPFFAVIAAMAQSENEDDRRSARRVLETVTGLKGRQLPSTERRRSLQPLQRRVEQIRNRIETLDRRIKVVGEGDEKAKRQWIGEIDMLRDQYDALTALDYVFEKVGFDSEDAIRKRWVQRQVDRENAEIARQEAEQAALAQAEAEINQRRAADAAAGDEFNAERARIQAEVDAAYAQREQQAAEQVEMDTLPATIARNVQDMDEVGLLEGVRNPAMAEAFRSTVGQDVPRGTPAPESGADQQLQLDVDTVTSAIQDRIEAGDRRSIGQILRSLPPTERGQINKLGDLPQETQAALKQFRRDRGGPPGPKAEGSDGSDPAGPSRYRLSDRPLTDAVPGERLAEAVDRTTRNWKNAPRVALVESDAPDLPPRLAEDMAKLPEGARPKAVMFEGEVFVFRNQHESEQDIALSVYHETVGHFGVRAVLGDDAALNGTLDQIIKARPDDVRFIAKRYGLDMSDPLQRREAAEELLAAQAESLYEDGLLTRLLERLRAWWADRTGQQMTDAQIMRDLIRPAEGFLAGRNQQGFHRTPTGQIRRYKLDEETSYDDELFVNENTEPFIRKLPQNLAAGLNEAAARINFTKTLLNTLAERLPSATRFRQIWERSQHITNQWGQKHQRAGSMVMALNADQASKLARAAVYYSSKGLVPFVSERSRLLTYDSQTDTVTESAVGRKDVELDPARFKALDEETQAALRELFETTSEVLLAHTQMKMAQAKHYRDLLIETGGDPVEINAQYVRAMNAHVASHNRLAKRAYVSQFRRSGYTVIAKSQEYLDTERQAFENDDPEAQKRLTELKGDPQHYILTAEKSRADAQAQRAELTARGLTAEFVPNINRARETVLQSEDIASLLADYDKIIADSYADREKTTIPQLTAGMHNRVSQLLADMGRADSLTASALEKLNVAGVSDTSVIENTLDYIKHFGAQIAKATTTPERVAAVADMQAELKQLRNEDADFYGRRYGQLVRRLNKDVMDPADTWQQAAQKAMATGSFMYLLTNASYYILQLTQPYMLTVPQLAGEFGAADSVRAMNNAVTQLKPLMREMMSAAMSGAGGIDLTFEGFPPNVRDMLGRLQERNILDVGLSQEFGSAGQGVVGRAFQKTFLAGRMTELTLRTAAALAAYWLRVAKDTGGKGLDNFDTKQGREIHEKAIDYANWMVYKTQGDYSFGNANMAYRNPVARVVLQFTKIAVVVGELLAENIKDSMALPRVNPRTAQLLLRAGIEPDLVARIRNRWGRLTEAEITQVQQAARTYIENQSRLEDTLEETRWLERALESELSPEVYVTAEQQAYARKAFLGTLLTSGVIGGSLTVPFATAALALVLSRLDEDEEDEASLFEAVTGGDRFVMDALGPEWGTLTTKGVLAHLVGIDVSQRIGINFMQQVGGGSFEEFKRAESPSQALPSAVFSRLGPLPSVVLDWVRSVEYANQAAQIHGTSLNALTSREGLKAMAYASPLGLRNLINSVLMAREGVTNDSRDVLIPRDRLTDLDIMRKAIGLQPNRVSRFYDMRQHAQSVNRALDRRRLLIQRLYLEGTRERDPEKVRRAFSQWRDLNARERELGVRPSSFDRMRQYRTRKEAENRDMSAGVRATDANRRLLEEIESRYVPEDER